jgi:hypothetical protein
MHRTRYLRCVPGRPFDSEATEEMCRRSQRDRGSDATDAHINRIDRG